MPKICLIISIGRKTWKLSLFVTLLGWLGPTHLRLRRFIRTISFYFLSAERSGCELARLEINWSADSTFQRSTAFEYFQSRKFSHNIRTFSHFPNQIFTGRYYLAPSSRHFIDSSTDGAGDVNKLLHNPVQFCCRNLYYFVCASSQTPYQQQAQ